MNYNEYLYKTYSAWLGKNIGIRLGAPVEGFTYEQILDTYGELRGYPVEYNIFAADDDSNGPAIFVTVLADHTPETLTPEAVGEVFLNYIQEYEGFFWWGGVGVSTEHTAYENLKNGIKAPDSGSAAVNGIALAEQIGGQIFSDCWGYVSRNDPQLARELAVKAASVTHDKNGIQGAIFVAVAICLAYTEKDCVTIIEKTLEYLEPELEYSRVVKDILMFYRNHPDDWRLCLGYIRSAYGYNKYPGVCHIIPNTALMVMAMCYGKNDFSDTLLMLCQCGWDTDCNCGNVGSILGAMVGIEGIEERWISPINDILNLSTAIGCLNIRTISGTSRMFTDLAFQMERPEKQRRNMLEMEFQLPYATNGFWHRDTDRGAEFYKYTYYRGEDIHDSRYDPSFSPIVYPGDRVKIEFSCKNPRRIIPFSIDCKDRYDFGETEEVYGSGVLYYCIPTEENKVISRIGFLVLDGSADEIEMKKVTVLPGAEFQYDFADFVKDVYGPRFGGGTLEHIRGLVVHSGKWDLKQKVLYGEAQGHGLITTGRLSMESYDLDVSLRTVDSTNTYVVFHCKGYRDFYGTGIEDGKLVICHWKHGQKETLECLELSAIVDGTADFHIEVRQKSVHVSVGSNGTLDIFLQEEKPYGIIGLYLEKEGSCGCLKIKMSEIRKKEETK